MYNYSGVLHFKACNLRLDGITTQTDLNELDSD